MLRSNSESLHVVSPEEEKERVHYCIVKDLQKRKV